MNMAFAVLLVFLALLLTTETERSKHSSTKDRLCFCSDRVLRVSSDSEASSQFVSCEDKCTTKGKEGSVLSKVPPRHLRKRRDLIINRTAILANAKNCLYTANITEMHVKIKSVTFHESGTGSEWYAEVTWVPFTGSDKPWIGYSMFYFIENRTLSSCLNLPKNQTSVNITSSAKEKTIALTVVALPVYFNTDGYGRLRLSSYEATAAPYAGTLPTLFKPTESTTENEVTVTTYVSLSVGILVGVALGAGLLVYFMCRKKTSYFPSEFKFHAFIIYNKDDSSWVSKELLPFLEEENHIKCCIHYRDFTPGMPFLDSMAESVYKSYKIIAVFSSNFLQSSYCNHELDLAQYRLLNQRDDSLIIIRIDKTDPNNLPRELRKRNFIDYADVLERPFWKPKLLRFLNSGIEGDSLEQEGDNNNGVFDDSMPPRRAAFDRLNSTTSNATEISIVTLNEERGI